MNDRELNDIQNGINAAHDLEERIRNFHYRKTVLRQMKLTLTEAETLEKAEETLAAYQKHLHTMLALGRAVVLEKVIIDLKRGDCWCEMSIGNPMVKDHSPECKGARAILANEEFSQGE